MKTKAIILDLDDTIFHTRSMDSKVFEPFFHHISTKLKSEYASQSTNYILNDLWKIPLDQVIAKHEIPFALIKDSIDLLESMEINLKISTFEDYTFLKNMSISKFLVTTGLTHLQKAKIKALGIAEDFEKIIINDTLKEAKTKQDIFYDLQLEFNLIPESTYVLGDNPESEIRAGNALNFTTIQILRENVQKGNNALYYIHSFDELARIII